MSSMWNKRKEIKASNPYSVKPPSVNERVVKLEGETKAETKKHEPIMERVSRLESAVKHLRQQNAKMVDMMEMIIKRFG
jgi:hypothetical protein